jgi:hypothetical protein
MNDSATIGEAARRTGLPPRTIRFYEQAGLLPAAARSSSGYRLLPGLRIERAETVSRPVGDDRYRIDAVVRAVRAAD